MSLIQIEIDGADFFLVNPCWCGKDWFLKATEDECVIGIRIIRQDITDKTLATRMRSCLRQLRVRGKLVGNIYRDTGVFRDIKGGEKIYTQGKAGICDVHLIGKIITDLMRYLDHGDLISGYSDLENQIIWNEEINSNARKRNYEKDSRKIRSPR